MPFLSILWIFLLKNGQVTNASILTKLVHMGDATNLEGQIFVGGSAGNILKTVFAVAVVTPFFFIGFDVIPQAAEEINVPLKKSERL